MKKLLTIEPWHICAPHAEQLDQAFCESIFSQGNGYMGARGFDSIAIGHQAHERSIFLAGFFDYIKPGITDMVNTPDLFSLRLSPSGKEQSASMCLDMGTGLLTRKAVWQLENGGRVQIITSRVISMHEKHACAQQVKLTPLDEEMECVLEVGIDGDVANLPISDHQMSHNTEIHRLLTPVVCQADQQGGYLVMETRPSRRRLYQAYRVRVNLPLQRKGVTANGYTAVRLTGRMPKGQTLTVEKLVATYCYRDQIDDLAQAETVAATLGGAGFDAVFAKSSEAWQTLWDTCDILLDSDRELQGAIRYNIFQLLQNNAATNPQVSIGARGLIHGRYKGNYFWDTEIFMLPFYLYTRPEAAKNLLLYRYHTLPDALAGANGFGLKGARYPWMCSDTGHEQCESWDTGCCEVHITADIAYAIQNYVRMTGDTDFLIRYGAEILIQTARYWVSRATYCPKEDCYNILFVKGPDEYCGVTSNNSYTNFLVRENLRGAISAAEILGQHPIAWKTLQEKTQITDEELSHFYEVAEKIVILYDESRELLLEDENFERLEPFDVASHKNQQVAMYRTMSYDRLQRYKVIKQADLVLLMTLFPKRFSITQKDNVWRYYEPLTLHDSSLSFGIHAQLAAELGYDEAALDYLEKSAFLDLANVMDNTDHEGIHLAALGATWQALVFGMAGLGMGEDGTPTVHPRLPTRIRGMRFSTWMKGQLYRITIDSEGVSVKNV